MTTLRSFQAEIEEFSHSQHLKQIRDDKEKVAAHGVATHSHPKTPHPARPIRPSKSKPVDTNQPQPTAGEDEQDQEIHNNHGEDVKPSLESLLLDLPPTSDSLIRTLIGSLLLTGHGEYLLTLGAHPTPGWLYGDQEGPVETIGRPLTEERMRETVTRLKTICRELTVEVEELYSVAATATTSPSGPYSSHLLRLPPSGPHEIQEVRICVVGNVDAGKSTMLGVLTRGGLDDGRGKARVALFRHKHEIETGRTSSVGMEILGFSTTGDAVIPTSHGLTPDGTTITTSRREKISWDEISSKSAKIISFIDLAGHERYLKTTLFGLTGCQPDYVMLIVGGNAGLIGMSKEHLGVALALQVPVIVAVTKIDMTPAHVLEQTIKQLVKVLKSPGCRKTPVFVETVQQAVDCARYVTTERICPIFLVSNVTGANLPTLRRLLNVLPSSQVGDRYQTDAPLEFSISDAFSVPFVGSVASGVITSGRVHTGQPVLLGPDSTGQFIPTVIKSIQRKRSPVESADAGQSVSFGLKKIRRSQLRKGQVIVALTDDPPKAVKRFEGQVLVLYHNTTIQPRYQAVMHINSIRQTARIISMDHPKNILRTGDRARVIFELERPELIRVGNKLLFREGKTKGLGVVTRVNV